MGNLNALVGVLILASITNPVASVSQEVSVIAREEFGQPALGPEWAVDVSKGNTVTLGRGYVEIRAAENTYAHLERRLERDHVRASCALQPGSGVSWCTSLFFYWRPTDWCQIGVIPRGNGRYYVCITSGGERDEYDLTRCPFAGWHRVAIELGEDCMRFLTSPDGLSWKTELFVPRPPSLIGPPALLAVGSGRTRLPQCK